jgi:hypothetical protein
MVLAILIVLGLSIVCPIIGAIIGIIGGIKNRNTNHASNYHTNFHDNHRTSFSHEQRDSRSNSNPFDNHWESSFDWKDEDNDGYDDRNDGFWNEREF